MNVPLGLGSETLARWGKQDHMTGTHTTPGQPMNTLDSDKASQEEQNGPNFSSVAPSSEGLWVRKEIRTKRLTIVHGFRPESDIFVPDKKGCHQIGHLKRSRMEQTSVP